MVTRCFKAQPRNIIVLITRNRLLDWTIPIWKISICGVAGSLLVAVVLSLIGVPVDNGVKAILFALFIYAVGFESGPQFLNHWVHSP